MGGAFEDLISHYALVFWAVAAAVITVAALGVLACFRKARERGFFRILAKFLVLAGIFMSASPFLSEAPIASGLLYLIMFSGGVIATLAMTALSG